MGRACRAFTMHLRSVTMSQKSGEDQQDKGGTLDQVSHGDGLQEVSTIESKYKKYRTLNVVQMGTALPSLYSMTKESWSKKDKEHFELNMMTVITFLNTYLLLF